MSLPAALGGVLLGLAAAVAVGAAVSRAFTRGLGMPERAAWSLAAGLLVQTACLLLLLILDVSPRVLPLVVLEGTVAAVALVLGRGSAVIAPAPPVRPADVPNRALVVLLGALALCAWLVFLVGALAESMWATDFLAIWGLKGKTIFLTAEIPRRLFEDPALYFAHKEYPLLVSLSLAGLAGFAGAWHDQALALLYPACEAMTLLALYGFLRRRVSPLAGATGAALASLCFHLYRPANAGTAEIPLALGLVLLVSAALDFLDRNATSSAWRLALAALFCAALKQEGTLFVALTGIALLGRLRADPGASKRAAAALLLPAAAHGLALYLFRGNQTRRDFDFTLLEPSRWAELPPIFAAVASRLLLAESRAALPAIVAIVVFFLVTRRGLADPLLPVFVAQMLVCAVAFGLSSYGPMYAIDSAFARITMTLFPAFAIVLGARVGPGRLTAFP